MSTASRPITPPRRQHNNKTLQLVNEHHQNSPVRPHRLPTNDEDNSINNNANTDHFETASNTSTAVSMATRGGNVNQSLLYDDDGARSPQESGAQMGDFDERPAVTLTWKDLTYEVKHPKTKQVRKILDGISGHVAPGQLLALLGPSGAGKTSMLDILAQRKKGGTMHGELMMNGHPIEQGVFRRVSAYVQQEDLMHGFLTVRETITYAARLRLPPHYNAEMIKEKTTNVMRLLGIDHIAESKIGAEMVRGISGGEKKRTAIAMELVTSPALLFLDEPTTGLDTFTALHLIHLLKKLASQGTTIIFSIHQPRSSIFRLFDSVLVLNGHGEEAYFGPSATAMDFLVSVGVKPQHPDNPADFLLDSVSVVRSAEELDARDFPFLPPPTQAQDIAAAFRSTKLNDVQEHIDGVSRTYEFDSKLPAAMNSPYHRGIFTQIAVVSARAFINKARDPIATFVAILVAILFALLVGSIYFQLKTDYSGIQDRFGVLFFLTMNTAFSSLGSISIFLFDRAIYVREHANGMYRPSSYYLGKVVQDIPLAISVNLLFSAIAYFMVGLQATAEKFGWFFLISTLIMLNSYSMCLFISNLAKNLQIANLLAPLFLVLLLLPSGFLINLNSLPVYWRWIKYISFFRFGFEAIVVNEFDGLTFSSCFPPMALNNLTFPANTSLAVQIAVDDIIANSTGHQETSCTGAWAIQHQLGFEVDTFKYNILWTGISASVYFILGYFCLRLLRSGEGK